MLVVVSSPLMSLSLSTVEVRSTNRRKSQIWSMVANVQALQISRHSTSHNRQSQTKHLAKGHHQDKTHALKTTHQQIECRVQMRVRRDGLSKKIKGQNRTREGDEVQNKYISIFREM